MAIVDGHLTCEYTRSVITRPIGMLGRYAGAWLRFASGEKVSLLARDDWPDVASLRAQIEGAGALYLFAALNRAADAEIDQVNDALTDIVAEAVQTDIAGTCDCQSATCLLSYYFESDLRMPKDIPGLSASVSGSTLFEDTPTSDGGTSLVRTLLVRDKNLGERLMIDRGIPMILFVATSCVLRV